MDLDYIADGAVDAPLVRFSAFDEGEAMRLRTAVGELATGEAASIVVHRLPGMRSGARCELVFEVGQRDLGISMRQGEEPFRCILTRDAWAEMAGLIDPFTRKLRGYQWLNSDGEVSLLISCNGQW